MESISDPNAVLRAEAQYVDGRWFVNFSGNNDVLNCLYAHRWIYHVFNGKDQIVNKMSIVFCAENPEKRNEHGINETYDPDCNCATCRLERVQASHKREIDRLTREKLELEGNAKYWQESCSDWKQTAKTLADEYDNLVARNKIQDNQVNDGIDGYLEMNKLCSELIAENEQFRTTIRVLSKMIE